MLDELTKQAFGAVGINQAVGVDAAVITDPGPGRWKIWGTCRHTLADGLRLLVGAVTIIQITNSPTTSMDFGPVVVDILNKTDDIIVELAVATGAADSASATVYAQKVAPL